jgi:hypothetical protein
MNLLLEFWGLGSASFDMRVAKLTFQKRLEFCPLVVVEFYRKERSTRCRHV